MQTNSLVSSIFTDSPLLLPCRVFVIVQLSFLYYLMGITRGYVVASPALFSIFFLISIMDYFICTFFRFTLCRLREATVNKVQHISSVFN